MQIDPTWAWRFATPADAAGLVALVRAAYRGGKGWTSEAHLVEGERTDLTALTALITGAGSRTLLVEEGGRPVACCRLEDGEGRIAHLGMFAVDPPQQGAGLGRWLVRQAELVAAERFEANALEISVLVQQAALLAWYERLGFVRTGERRPFPAHPRFARPVHDDLELAVLRKPIAPG
jgi:ribosomal protein S18 acetylase RimI-like enzyme